METKFVFKLKRRSQPEMLLGYILLMPFLFGVLLELLLLSNVIKYTLDIAWLFLLVLIFVNNRKNKTVNVKNRILTVSILLFFLFTLVTYMIHHQSLFFFLWGLRNNFRFYVFFFAAIIFFRRDDISAVFKLFDILFWINSLVTLIQYFILKINGDFLGGIFGTEVGCNRYTNIFSVIILSISVIKYINKQEKIVLLIAKFLTSMIIAALAELKFFYVEAVVIIVIAVLITDFSWKKILLILGGFLLIALGAFLLGVVFPNSAGFLNLEVLYEIASSDKGYTSSGDLNRLTAIPNISQNILTSVPEKLFGLGLGNCDYGAYDFLVTPFYTEHSHLRYDWFSVAFMFLETGFIGLLFFLGFFLIVFVLAMKLQKKSEENKIYCQIAMLASFSCFLIALYNASLRTESGYMMYFILALPFIAAKGDEPDIKITKVG